MIRMVALEKPMIGGKKKNCENPILPTLYY